MQIRRARLILNPSRAQWIGGAAAIGVTAIVAKLWWDHRQPSPHLPPLPPPPEGTAPGSSCELGDQYPGFVFDGTECVPGDMTPAGIYLVDDCTDFVFKPGDEGLQPEDLDARIQTAAAASIVDHDNTVDPTTLVTDFLNAHWPQCTWPPAPDGPERLVQMYMALSHLVGRSVISDGGNVLGRQSLHFVDEDVATRLNEMGYAYFQPEVVPEFDLDENEEPDQGGGGDDGGGGNFPSDDHDQPPQGGFGGPTGPQGGGGGGGGGGGQPPAPPACTKHRGDTLDRQLGSVTWQEQKPLDIDLFTPSSNKCHEYEVKFGICITPLQGSFGWLDEIHNDQSAMSTLFMIKDNDGNPLPNYDNFRLPILWKKQWKTTLVYNNGKLSFKYGGIASIQDSSIDPCIGKPMRWPVGTFRVTDEANFERLWHATPVVTVHIRNNNMLFARVTVTGMPQFVKKAGEFGGHPQDYGYARNDKSNAYVASVKVDAIGKV